MPCEPQCVQELIPDILRKMTGKSPGSPANPVGGSLYYKIPDEPETFCMNI